MPVPRRHIIAACVFAAVAVGAVTAVPAASRDTLTASWTGWLNSGLNTYADTAGAWNSGGDAVPVGLPDGRALWLFGGSYEGPVGADGTADPARARYVPNLALVTRGTGGSFRVEGTVTRPSAPGAPRAEVRPAVPVLSGFPSGASAEPGAAIVSGHSVVAVYDVLAPAPAGSPAGAGSLEPAGSEIVTIPLGSVSDARTWRVAKGPSAGGVQWGRGLIGSTDCPAATGLASCTYVYGEQWPARAGAAHRLVEAVAPSGAVGDPGAWWYDTTSGWERAARSLTYPLGSGTEVSGVSAYAVDSDTYVLLSGDGAAGVRAYYASTPALTGARSTVLFGGPDLSRVPGAIAYDYRIESAYSSGRSVVLGFSVNAAAHDQACLNYAPFYSARAFRPEFYSVTLPPDAGAALPAGTLSAPRSGAPRAAPPGGEVWSTGPCDAFTTVPTPGGLQARYAGHGQVDLEWSDAGGLYRYDLRRLDQSTASSDWAPLRSPAWDPSCPGVRTSGEGCVSDEAATSLLAPGHTYLYEIEASNWAGGNSGGFAGPGVRVTLPGKLSLVTSPDQCAGVSGAGPGVASGAGLSVHQCSPKSGADQWYYTIGTVSGGQYITNVGTGKCLVPADSRPGSAVTLGPCRTPAGNRAGAGAWEFELTDSGYDFALFNAVTGLCLHPGGAHTLVQARCGPGRTWHSSLAY